MARELRGSAAQRGVLWASILCAVALYVGVMSFSGWHKEYVAVSCPDDSYIPCENVLWHCVNSPMVALEGRNAICLDPVWGQSICERNPSLCQERYIPVGVEIGIVPHWSVQYLDALVAFCLILGAVGYYWQGWREARK